MKTFIAFLLGLLILTTGNIASSLILSEGSISPNALETLLSINLGTWLLPNMLLIGIVLILHHALVRSIQLNKSFSFIRHIYGGIILILSLLSYNLVTLSINPNKQFMGMVTTYFICGCGISLIYNLLNRKEEVQY